MSTNESSRILGNIKNSLFVFVEIHKVVNKKLGAIHSKGGRKTIFDRLLNVKYQHDISLAAKHLQK